MSRNLLIKKYFVFLESASKEQQPMQEAIDYCKDPKNEIDVFIIKSIDRFTRGGSLSYDLLKSQLESHNVRLIDIYGIISAEQVNTLDHLGFAYKWSVYSPSKKSEILEAERSKDELRDIMSRMIGAEIRYTQMGFWMREAPYGFVSEKIETRNGKRCILKPHPVEAPFMRQLFELRDRGIKSDQEIVDTLNRQGFKTRTYYVRSKHDRTKIIARRGGEPLSVKALQKLVVNPIYAGVNVEKWTNDQPVHCAFEGLVSIEQFNRANRGKKMIIENGQGELSIYNKPPKSHLVQKGRRNADFPYRKYVLCSKCEKPLLGSASRGKSGKYYPAYHCSNHGHYYRIPKQELEDTITEFIGSLRLSQEHIDAVISAIETEWTRRQAHLEQELQTLEAHISELKEEAQLTASKVKLLSNETTIAYIEEEVMRIEKQIAVLTKEKAAKTAAKPIDFQKLLGRVRYFLEHFDELLVKQIDPIKKAQLFGALFTKLPTYENLKPGTPENGNFTGVNPLFQLAKMEKSLMVNYQILDWHQIKSELLAWYAILKDNTLFNTTTLTSNLRGNV